MKTCPFPLRAFLGAILTLPTWLASPANAQPPGPGITPQSINPCRPEFLTSQSYHGRTQCLFRALDKSGASTQILYDYVFPMAGLNVYYRLQAGEPNAGPNPPEVCHPDLNTNNASQTPSLACPLQVWENTTGFLFEQAHAELGLAMSLTGGNSWQVFPELAPRVAAHTTWPGTLPVGMLFADFNQLDPEAVEKGLLTYENDMYFDVPNRPASPYLVKHVGMMALFKDVVKLGPVNLRFTNDLKFGNNCRNLNLSVQVGGITYPVTNFDAGPVNLPVTFTQTGKQYVTITARYNRWHCQPNGICYEHPVVVVNHCEVYVME
jgi:hypothetical protein